MKSRVIYSSIILSMCYKIPDDIILLLQLIHLLAILAKQLFFIFILLPSFHFIVKYSAMISRICSTFIKSSPSSSYRLRSLKSAYESVILLRSSIIFRVSDRQGRLPKLIRSGYSFSKTISLYFGGKSGVDGTSGVVAILLSPPSQLIQYLSFFGLC